MHSDSIKSIRYKELYLLKIGLIYVYYLIAFHYVLLFVMYILSLDHLVNLLLFLSLRMIYCISAEHLYARHIAGLCIGEWPPT